MQSSYSVDTESLTKLLARVGALSYAIWGVFHVYVSWQIFSLALPLKGVAQGRMFQLAAYMLTIALFAVAIALWRKAGESVGLVPTMGSLHEGHLALVRQAKADGGRAVATLFVNPTQFGANEDLAAYPRDESTDRALLGQARADLLFAPDVDEIYPEGFATTVTVARLTEHLCGSHRPGHFAGVATVVGRY